MRSFIKASVFLFFSFIISCTSVNKQKKNLREVTDATGRKVFIPDSIESVIALRSGSLRLIAYLNAVDRIVAVEANEHRRRVPYLYAYPEIRKLPRIGTGNMAEPELISAYQPDMILMTYTTAGEAIELQNKTSCPVIVVDYGDFNQNIDKFFNTLKFLGKLLDKENRAKELIAEINAYIFDLNNRTYKSPDTKSVYVGGIAYRGAHGINSTEPMYAPFRFINANNVAENLGEVTSSPKAWLENAFIDKEQLIEWNPDMIFIDAAGLQLVDKDISDRNFSTLLKAVRSRNTYVVLPHNWYTTNYENILCNAYYIGKVMYPESFINIDTEKRCGDIYRKFLGTNVFDSMMTQYNAYRRYE